MPHGWKDYTMPVTVEAVTVETLPVDIKAQTIAALKIDVAAQTLPQLNVNLAACAVTLNVNISSSAVTLNVKTAVGEHVDTDIVSSVTLKTDIAAQSVGNIGVDIKAQTLSQLNVNIAACTVTLNVNIASSSTTLNVNLASSSITLNVCIASQTVDVNIKTSGGANIVIDKLTQSAYTSRVATLAWNGTSPSWYAPKGNDRCGKLFPRGARGFMRNIGIYCRDAGTAGGTVYVFISPSPYLGPVYSGTITVPAAGAADWRNWAVNKMWNYDSLFIWAYTTSDYIQLAYDTGGPDCFSSTDGGLTWTGHPTDRYWFRAEVQGMTVGDVPVSGTLNTVEIPNVFSELKKFVSPVLDGGTIYDILPRIYGCGVLTCFTGLFAKYDGNVEAVYQVLGIEVDGISREISMYDLAHPSDFVVNAVHPVSFSKFDTANQRFAFGFNFPIKFKRSLRIYVRNNAAVGNKMVAYALIGYELLS